MYAGNFHDADGVTGLDDLVVYNLTTHEISVYESRRPGGAYARFWGWYPAIRASDSGSLRGTVRPAVQPLSVAGPSVAHSSCGWSRCAGWCELWSVNPAAAVVA